MKGDHNHAAQSNKAIKLKFDCELKKSSVQRLTDGSKEVSAETEQRNRVE